MTDTHPSHDFAVPIAQCLTYNTITDRSVEDVAQHVRTLLEDNTDPTREHLTHCFKALHSLPQINIALIYGGATRIKSYLFEAPRLPEIRGASVLLDWVNQSQIPRIWDEVIDQHWAQECLIYASGGNILGFAPVSCAEQIATRIEQCYTEHTLTANSVAVYEIVPLVAVRYGWLSFNDDNTPTYSLEDFERDWSDPAKRQLLEQYYAATNAPQPADRFRNRKRFGELVTLLANKALHRRDEWSRHGQIRYLPSYPLIPWAAKCDSSDIRPAVWQGTIGEDTRELSASSARKRYAGQISKRDDANTRWYTKDFLWCVDNDMDNRSWSRQWERYLATEGAASYYAKNMPSETVRPAHDLSEIADAGDGYIGLIYADGNNVGRRVAACKTPSDYRSLSQRLDHASQQAVFTALSSHLKPVPLKAIKRGEQDTYVHPFEILSVGGDDMLLIVPGTEAFDVALTLGYTFEQTLASSSTRADFAGDRYCGTAELSACFTTYTADIGLSAGVIVARKDAPIFFLYNLVTELLTMAKRGNRGTGGTVDFMVMKSISMVTDNIQSFRRTALGSDSPRRLTARPYTWHELAGLVATVRELKRVRFPRSQLARLEQVITSEPASSTLASTMEYLYTRVRLRESFSTALITNVEAAWRGTAPPAMPPWLNGQGYKETLWYDLNEIYAVIKDEG